MAIDCPAQQKSDTRKLNPIPRALNGLALLACGNKQWHPLVKRVAQWTADFTTSGYLLAYSPPGRISSDDQFGLPTKRVPFCNSNQSPDVVELVTWSSHASRK